MTPGADLYREVGAALALIDLGYVNQQSLYSWAFSEATRVIEALIAWTDGEIYFEEDQQPPSDRLLIALPISSMLPEQPSPSLAQPVAIGAAPSTAIAHPVSNTASVTPSSISDALTMHGEMPTLFDDSTAISSFFASPGTVPDTERYSESRSTMGTLLPPQPVSAPTTPIRVDMAYMQPHMVITPVDLSVYREQNPQIPFTPDQWRLFTRADGQTTLQLAAQELSMSPEQVCQVAGELVALGVITLSQQAYGYGDRNEPSLLLREHLQASPSNGMLTPAYAAPSPNPLGRPLQLYPIETHSQWGNGGNGAIFVLGNGWVVAPPSAAAALTTVAHEPVR